MYSAASTLQTAQVLYPKTVRELIRMLSWWVLLTPFLVGAAGSLGAATIVVDSQLDENTGSTANGSCTLREAVLAANGNAAVDGCTAGEAAPVVDLIQIPAGAYELTITETNDAEGGSLDLEEDVDLTGAGWADAVIDGLGAYIRLIEVPAGVTVEVSGLTMRGGGSTFAVLSEGSLSLEACRVTENSSNGVKTLNGGAVSINGCLIDNNGTDGVVNNPGGDAVISDTTISDNGDAGIENHSTLVVDGVTVTGNKHGIVGYGSWQILNSTISGNDGTSGTGGAGLIVTIDGVALVSNTTITDNLGDWGAGIFLNSPNAEIQLQNTIVAGNLGNSSNCYIAGTLLSTGGNIESPGNACGFSDASDQVNVSSGNLVLGPLADHGGPTYVHGLEPGSVALDAGVASGPAVSCPGVDQRGLARTDGLCDVGSVEVQAGENMTVIFSDDFETGTTARWTDLVGG